MNAVLAVFADWHHDGHGWWIVFVPLFWIAVITGLVLLVRARGGWGPPRIVGHRESALEVLDRRYAQGEIDIDEYRERRSVLTDHPERPGD
jgi:putative membrane protein